LAGLFPKWMNALPTLGALAGVGGLVSVVAGGWYWLTPDFWEVGFMPEQPGSGFNHQIHAGTLGIDCRYCHTHVEDSKHSNVPSVATCYGCHSEGKIAEDRVPTDKVQFIRTAYASGESIPWENIHVVPDYANFPHHVHVSAGVSCYSCHGQIRGMPVVYQDQSLAMGWCLGLPPQPRGVPGPQGDGHGPDLGGAGVDEQARRGPCPQRDDRPDAGRRAAGFPAPALRRLPLLIRTTHATPARRP
jgi:hypothetical protein